MLLSQQSTRVAEACWAWVPRAWWGREAGRAAVRLRGSPDEGGLLQGKEPPGGSLRSSEEKPLSQPSTTGLTGT